MQETQALFLGQKDPPGEGDGNPFQYFCLENPMDRGAWQAIVHGITRVGHNLATKPPILDGYLLFLDFQKSNLP